MAYITQNTEQDTEEIIGQIKLKQARIPAAGQKHGLLYKDWARQEDIPAGPNVIRTKKHKYMYYNITHRDNDSILVHSYYYIPGGAVT